MTVRRFRAAAGIRRSVVTVGVGLLLSACGPATAPIGAAPTPTPNTLDLSRWTASTLGSGPTATAGASGGVDLLIPANATQDSQKHFMAITLEAKCKLSGDFDLQVDYSLVSWPARNSVRLGLAAGSYSVERSSNVHTVMDNLYVTDFAGVQAIVGTQDITGRLRLTRVGATITGYYGSNGSWVKVASAKTPTEATDYRIAAWTDYDAVVKSDVSMTVTHFTVSPGAPGCP